MTKFPYWAFERTSKAIVKVVRIEGKLAILEGGGKAWLKDLSQPEWIQDAVQDMEDWADEVDTQRAAQDKPPQWSDGYTADEMLFQRYRGDKPPLWERPEAYGERGRSKLFKS